MPAKVGIIASKKVKRFFFEKKKQKTFYVLVSFEPEASNDAQLIDLNGQQSACPCTFIYRSFLVLFFKKGRLACPRP